MVSNLHVDDLQVLQKLFSSLSHQFSLRGETVILLLLLEGKEKKLLASVQAWNKCASLSGCSGYSWSGVLGTVVLKRQDRSPVDQSAQETGARDSLQEFNIKRTEVQLFLLVFPPAEDFTSTEKITI